MITENYVSFETAKLLKERGFDEYNPLWYNLDKPIEGPFFYKEIGWYGHNSYSYAGRNIISAPTLQMAMKWLREEHKIHIQIWILEENGYWFDIEKILNTQYKHKSLYSTGLEDLYFDTYEEACEAAIKYCLEHLI